ncbi:MAG TPA: DUF1284 domain-containing protein [Candidatus Manganitrophaceae bacterium]|nr:DUF1284 domain-containing protein [Candidatus Manganitrophaceae bacterium]
MPDIFDKAGKSDYNSSMKNTGSDRLILRGHTLLCLQGFRGEGYSPEFVENLFQIDRRLAAASETAVEVVCGPDRVCAACPHLESSGCRLNGPGSEGEMKEQDAAVMRRLGIEKGAVLPWSEILRRISGTVQGADLAEICGSCRWRPLGYCREGIERLKERDLG